MTTIEADHHSIERLALGRAGSLGDLYDARQECFSGGNIFRSKMPAGVVQVRDSPRYSCQIITMNAYSEMFKGFGFNGQLKASFLAGLVELGGSGAYLKDLKAGSRSVKATLKLEVETRYEFISMNNRSLERCLSSDPLWQDIGQATHFVAGMQWGAQAYASVENQSSMGGDAKGIEVKLSARLSELGASLLQMCGCGVGLGALKAKFNGEKGRIAMDEEEMFKFRVDADVLPDSSENMMLPKNFEEAWTVLSRIPAQLINNTSQGQGRPLCFTLYPLSQLEKKLLPSRLKLPFSLAPCYTSFNSLAIEALERLFDELQSTKQALHDLYEDVSVHHSAAFSSHDMENIATYRSIVEAAEYQLRIAVRMQIIAIRSQSGDTETLEKIIRDFSTESQSAPSNAQAFMGPYVSKLTRIISLKEHGVQFVLASPYSTTSSLVSNTESLPMPLSSGTSTWVVILTYCEPSGKNNQQDWKNNWSTFWHLHEQSRSGQDLKAGNKDSPVTGIHFYVQENQDGECTCRTRVSVYRDGDVVTEDAALLMSSDPHPSKLQENLVYSSVMHEVKMKAPNARIPLHTYCPGHHVQSFHMASCAKNNIKNWTCERCKECIDYGKDGFLYCGCGRAPLRACRFRCSSQKHGPLFVAFPANEDVEKILDRQEAPQQLNILLLGETGVGKSTFVNAFANYLTFGSLESAIDSAEDLVGLIPMAFTHTDQMTFETREIKFGHPDANEFQHEGQSATQTCRSYTIHLNQNQTVHLIDTPGIGDTRGIEHDELNFQNILSYLTHYTEIHGICVMLKPNTARLTVTFRFCIQELLRHLHKSASENIVFLFTNARSTFYTPGDTIVPLQTLLRQIQNTPPHVQIAFNQRTVYCMDNEAFRYLLASKEGCFFPPEDQVSYSQSWNKSAYQCHRMLEHFRTIEAHNVRETVSLNNAWSLVSKLQKPLEDVTNAIQRNLANWGAMKKDLEEFQGNSSELENIVKGDEVLDLQAVHFKKGPRMVCTSLGSCCERRESSNGEIEVFYTHVCHERCSSSKVVRVFAQGRALWFCKVMDRQGVCRVCNCHYNTHMRISYNTKLVPKKVVNNDIETKLHSKIEAKELKILELGQRCEEWQKELDAITQACARFALFFKNNAIAPFNNDMKAYVHHQIAVERSRFEYNKALIARWEAFLEAYQKQINDLERMSGINIEAQACTDNAGESRASHRNPSIYGTGADILELAANLYQLKHHGATIKALVEEVSQCEYRTQFHNKTFHGAWRRNVAKIKASVVAGSGDGALQCIVPAVRHSSNQNQGLKLARESYYVEKFKTSSSKPESYQNEVSSSKLETFSTIRTSWPQIGITASLPHVPFPRRWAIQTEPKYASSSNTHGNYSLRSLDFSQPVSDAKSANSPLKLSTYHTSSDTFQGRDNRSYQSGKNSTVMLDEYESKTEDVGPAFSFLDDNSDASSVDSSSELPSYHTSSDTFKGRAQSKNNSTLMWDDSESDNIEEIIRPAFAALPEDSSDATIVNSSPEFFLHRGEHIQGKNNSTVMLVNMRKKQGLHYEQKNRNLRLNARK